MAKSAKNKGETKITRISAKDTAAKPVKKVTVKPTKKAVVKSKPAAKTAKVVTESKRRLNPFAPIIRYFKGSWYELRQVRWPDRRATWSMTGALLAFTLFFVVVILLLDVAFEYLFKLIMGS